ncbi:MAG: ribonuclease D [Atopobiaceae bacterium]|nr:ribonuclease D [Atopobiaceae bacterium]
MYISDSENLARFCELARQQKLLAVDTEFLREKTYYPKLCLIQLAVDDEVAIVDPLVIDSLEPLAALFADEDITKVFHACTQDLEVIEHELGVVPVGIFDTQVAAAFLGKRMQMGYGALVYAYLTIDLEKSQSLTDWSKRPLDDDQLAYAADDVRYLCQIYRMMHDELVKLGRLSWLYSEEQPMLDPARFAHIPEQAYLSLRRSGSLTRRQLAIARELCAWRERTAQKRNIPRKWVASDEVIVELCRAIPKNIEKLKRIRGTEHISRRDAHDMVYAIGLGLGSPQDQYPRAQKAAHSTPDLESVVDLMYALLRLISEESGLASQLIANRQDLLEYVVDKSRSRINHGWRKELVGSKLDLLLEGHTALTVKDGKVELF